MTELCELGAAELVSAYAGRETTPFEVVESLLARIDEHDRRLGAFVTLCGATALLAAAARTRELSEGTSRGLLHGVPVAVKDIMDVAGVPVTCGSEALPVRTPTVDAACVARLRAAGAIIIGVTRTHEIAWGFTTQHSRLGGTRNPWDETRIPGGSSGGAAAAVAAQFVPLALGTDTGGSCRLPAAFCGVNGWKPTYGCVPMDGVLPLAYSLDHVGLIGRTFTDIILGDAALRQSAPSYRRSPIEQVLAEAKVGVLRSPEWPVIREDHRRVLDAAEAAVADNCLEVDEAPLKVAALAGETYRIVQGAEAYAVHHDELGAYPERAELYGADVRARLEAGSGVTPAEYFSAVRDARGVWSDMSGLLERFDILVSPVAPCGPPAVADPDGVEHFGRRLPLRSLTIPFSVIQNICRMPGAVVRAGFDDDGMPIGLQLSGRIGDDRTILRVAEAVDELLNGGGRAAVRAPLRGLAPVHGATGPWSS